MSGSNLKDGLQQEGEPTPLHGIPRNQLMVNMVVLCAISAAEGLDNALWPSVTYTLTSEYGFDIGAVGSLSLFQLFAQAIGGPVWGAAASNRVFSRKSILMIASLCQGMATCVMWVSLGLPWLFSVRILNGFFLAALRPIANSVVADMFEEHERGKWFGWIMSSMQFGNAVSAIAATSIADMKLSGNIAGWELAFLIIGGLTICLTPLVHFFVVAPPVKPPPPGTEVNFWRDLGKILKRPSFVLLSTQGMFGLIPWRAMDFRQFFFQKNGLAATQAGIISGVGAFTASAGSLLGGIVGDFLQSKFGDHGRPLCAVLSVFGGIPFAFFLFIVSAPEGLAFWYYATLIILLGLVASWTPAGANNPILCELADEKERALILGAQNALEGAIGSLGGFIFTFLLSNVFGIDGACVSNFADGRDDPAFPEEACSEIYDEVGSKAGQALFWCCFVPWLICGSFYAALHITYPRDRRNIAAERAALMGAEMSEANLN